MTNLSIKSKLDGGKMLIRRGYKMNKDSLRLVFEGDNDIDLKTLSVSLNSTVDVLTKLADYLLGENDYCKFKITNVEKGSFIIDISQIFEMAPTLFTYGPSVLEGFNNIIELRKTLKGQSPKEIKRNSDNTVNLIAQDGATINVYGSVFDVYTKDSSIEKSCANMAEAVSKDSGRKGIEFSFNDKKTTMNEEETKLCSKVLDVESFNENIKEQIMTCDLIVKMPDLLGGSKWQFRFLDKIIKADIKDNVFLSKVKNKELGFPIVSTLHVKMRVRYQDDKVISYTILEVLSYH